MKARTNGIELNYVVEGEGPWLTMSHSLACNLHMWDAEAAALAKRYKVLRFDTRGHGASDAPPGPYTLDQLADDLKGLFDALGVRETHFVGLSMGGMIGQKFALRYPGVFRSLTLADTTSRYPADAAAVWAGRIKVASEQGMEPLVQPTLERWFTKAYRDAQPDKVAAIATMIRSTPVAGYAGCCEALPKIDSTERLKEIRCPTLVIVGAEDGGTPPAMARAIHAAMPGSEYVEIPQAAHLSNIEQPAAFLKALQGLLDRAR
jgi:3-oxoadipate enol-lactonase